MKVGKLKNEAGKSFLTSESISETLGASGYFKLPGGTIVQYGSISTSTDAATTAITLPVSYKTRICSIVAICATRDTPVAAVGGTTLGAIRITLPSALSTTIFWMTMGY